MKRNRHFEPRSGLILVGLKTLLKGVLDEDPYLPFEELDHTVMLETVGESIHDNRFLRLLGAMLKAGYLEGWKWGATLSGAPQGGPASPILSSIYLDRLDNYVVTHPLPDYNRGERRAANPAYQRIEYAIARARRRKDRPALRRLRQQRRRLPSQDPRDPGYRRLRYVRYCDDFLLGFSGPKAETHEITERVRQFLRDELKLELSREKTLVTHAQTGTRPSTGASSLPTAHRDPHRPSADPGKPSAATS